METCLSVGVCVRPEDDDRLTDLIESIQKNAPGASDDECVDLIFRIGMEMVGGMLAHDGIEKEERAAFEEWVSEGGKWPKSVERCGDGYRLMQTNFSWAVWKARAELTPNAAPTP